MTQKCLEVCIEKGYLYLLQEDVGVFSRLSRFYWEFQHMIYEYG